MTIKSYGILFFLLVSFSAFTQESSKLKLSLEESEAIFLSENLQLLAERLEIPQAEAKLLQAKVWPNPTLTIDELNLWTTDYQKRTGEAQPSLLGSEDFGKYRQISAQIEQLIETAGKRKKRVALAEVSAAMAHSYLEDFLLNLKTEFRKTVYSFNFHESYANMLERQLVSLESIVNAYKKQYDRGNVNKTEIIRLQASSLAIKNDLIDENKILNKLTEELVVLLNLPERTELSFYPIGNTTYDYQLPANYTLSFLQEEAVKNRPDIRLNNLEVKSSEQQLVYEKAMSVPDVTLSVGYDRGGNILRDFIGVGFSIDLPFFDRNKGNIKKAKLEVEQQNYLKSNKLLEVREEVRKNYQNVLQAASFFNDIDSGYTDELDKVMDAYTEYFKLQSINIITYMDFLDSYIETKRSVLENHQEYLDDLEDLKTSTGLELKINN